MKWNLKNILYAASAILVVYIIGVLSIYIFINSILFSTQKTNRYDFTTSKRLEEITITLPQGQEFYALYCNPAQNNKGIVLFLHGAKGNLNTYYHLSSMFTRNNLSVLMPDFRSFGKSKGELSESSLIEDAMACMDWIRKRYREDSIIIYAQDFLAPVASTIAAMQSCRMMILENPVYSLRRWMRDRFPALMLPYELKYDFDITESLPNSICPTYIIQYKMSPNCNATDAKKMQILLKDPNALILIDSERNTTLQELSQYHEILDQLLNF